MSQTVSKVLRARGGQLEGKGIGWNSSRQAGEWTHNNKVLMVEATQVKRLGEAGLDSGPWPWVVSFLAEGGESLSQEPSLELDFSKIQLSVCLFS